MTDIAWGAQVGAMYRINAPWPASTDLTYNWVESTPPQTLVVAPPNHFVIHAANGWAHYTIVDDPGAQMYHCTLMENTYTP